MFLSFFWSTPLIWVPVSFPSLLVPCTFSFISLSIAFIFAFNLRPNSTNSVSFLITSVLNCASARLAISLLLSCSISGALICSFPWANFLSWCACYIKGQSLRCSPGQGNCWLLSCDAVCGGGAEREHWCLLHSLPDFNHSLHHPQSNWVPPVLIPESAACAHSRPLWVSPTNSPARLGVAPTAASTPMGVFNQRFEALFPRAGALGGVVCLATLHFLPVYLCANVGPWGLPAASLPSPLHNPPSCWVRQLPPCHGSPPRLPVSAPPTGLDECLLYLLGCWTCVQFDFLSVLVVFCF